MISEDLFVRFAISSPERFDTNFQEVKVVKEFDLTFPDASYKLILKEVPNVRYIDIRTKVEVTDSIQKRCIFYMDANGYVLLNGKLYRGSKKLLEYFRYDVRFPSKPSLRDKMKHLQDSIASVPVRNPPILVHLPLLAEQRE